MAGCDGCGRAARGLSMDDMDDDESVEVAVCEDCGWRVCDDCAVDKTRGPCRCLNSDMGYAYCDMEGPRHHMGANRGERYPGPFKCQAQRELEAQLMTDRVSGGRCLTACCFFACRKPLTPAQSKLCTRCRSVVYCSVECQRAAWTTPDGPRGTHKAACGAYLSPERWPFLSRDFKAYHEHWGRFPTAKLTPAQRAADEERHPEVATAEAATAQVASTDAAAVEVAARLEQAAVDDAYRRAYLRERDAMLMQAGLGEFAAAEALDVAATSPPPQSPGSPSSMAACISADPHGACSGAAVAMDACMDACMEEGGEEDGEMSQAEASARALRILNETRRKFGRRAGDMLS